VDEKIANYLLNQFLNISSSLTGFEKVELLGTGMAQQYYEELYRLYKDTFIRLLFIAKAVNDVCSEDQQECEKQIHKRIIGDVEFGQIARNIIQLWYMASYTNFNDPTSPSYIISPEAYSNGLIWQAMNSHPPGAKHPGFGSWSVPPHSETPD
jgi:hypothetical protein